MGYKSDVTVMCGKNAFEAILMKAKAVNFEPLTFKLLMGDTVAYGLEWRSTEWYAGLSTVGGIVEVLQNLDSLDETLLSADDSYAYKLIEIGEDCAVSERSNGSGDSLFGDFTVTSAFHLPGELCKGMMNTDSSQSETILREYIQEPVEIDGRRIPYPVFIASDYFKVHDAIGDVDTFMEQNWELFEMVNQIIALKQSCFLLRHTTHSCQSLSDDLYKLKMRLIKEVKEKFNYSFDDEWMESLVPVENMGNF